MDIWEIIPGKLWQSGGIADTSFRALGIDTVVSLAHQGRPTEDREFLHVHWPIEDSTVPQGADPEKFVGTLRALARLVVDLVGAGRKVLVHCGAGVNRSGLLNALVLVMLGDDGGKAIEAVRERRPGALGNQNFVDWLLRQWPSD